MDRRRLGHTGRMVVRRQRGAGYVSNISSPNLDIQDHLENGITAIRGRPSLAHPIALRAQWAENTREKLLGFLHDRNPQARQIALSNLLGHTPTGAPLRSIFFKGLQGGGFGKQSESEVVRDLKLLCRDQLVNRSSQSFDHVETLHGKILPRRSLMMPSERWLT